MTSLLLTVVEMGPAVLRVLLLLLLLLFVFVFWSQGRKDKTGKNTPVNSYWRSKEEKPLGEGHGRKERKEEVAGGGWVSIIGVAQSLAREPRHSGGSREGCLETKTVYGAFGHVDDYSRIGCPR